MQVSIYEAKIHLSKLVAQVKEGEEIIIAEAGKPIARLVPVVERPTRRVAGSAKDRITIAPDFDAPLSWETGEKLFLNIQCEGRSMLLNVRIRAGGRTLLRKVSRNVLLDKHSFTARYLKKLRTSFSNDSLS